MRRRDLLQKLSGCVAGAAGVVFLPSTSFARPSLVVKDGPTTLAISGLNHIYVWKHKGANVHVEFDLPRSFSLDAVRAEFDRLPHVESPRIVRQNGAAGSFS